MELCESVAFLLIKGNTVLAEKRKLTQKVMSGHLEEGESPEGALQREVREELGILPRERYYVCTLLHRAQEFRKLHYFAIHSWEGAMVNHEADALVWVPFDEVETFDLDVDRIAIGEYLRVYQAQRQHPAPPGDAAPAHEARGYPLKAGQLTYDCRYSTMRSMPVTGGRGFRGLKPLWYNSVPP
jgi:8-oxo-dGTP pyrophosphatase MutT (NUDIX family)